MKKNGEPNKPNLSASLARWYIIEFEHRPFDFRMDRQYLKRAKELINPTADPDTGEKPPAFEVEDVKNCLLALRDGTHPGLNGKRIDRVGFHTLSWGNLPYLLQWVDIPEMPPVYEHVAYDEWIRMYGSKAIKQGNWDGTYLGWSTTKRPEDGIGIEELCKIVGSDKMMEALEKWLEENGEHSESN